MTRTTIGLALLMTVLSGVAFADCVCPEQQDPDESPFRCSMPTGCSQSTYLCSPSFLCDEARGCSDCCDPPGADTCSQCLGCAANNGIDVCGLAADPPACPGSQGGSPLLGQPERDPFLFGILALEQVKAEDVTFHVDDPGDGTTGPACHLGTNCNTTSDNGPVGVVILNEATFPPGSQVVAGKTHWRSKTQPAVVDQAFVNDWVYLGGDMVCAASGGRQMWCPVPLLKHYCDDPATCGSGATDVNDCATDPHTTAQDRDRFCNCQDARPIKFHWNQVTGIDADAGEAFVSGACATNSTCPNLTVASGQTQTIRGDAFNCHKTVTVNPGGTLKLEPGNASTILVCSLNLVQGSASNYARVEYASGGTANAPINVFLRNLSVSNNARLFWVDDFHWRGAGASVPPASLRFGMFGAGTFTVGNGARLQGTFLAPGVDVNLGTSSSIRGRIIGKTTIGQPSHVYCACRGDGAKCATNSDCCGTCTDGVCTAS